MRKVIMRLSEIRDSSTEVLLPVRERSVWVRVASHWKRTIDLLPEEHPVDFICFCTTA